MSRFIDIHVLQNVPPSNINRDDTGSPKTATFGGVRRARVSSQAWKRAIRADFAQHFSPEELGERTLVVAERIAQAVSELRPDLADRSLELATSALQAAGIKVAVQKSKKSSGTEGESARTGALFFASRPQIKAIADIIVRDPDQKFEKKEVKSALSDGVTIDVALFGRMVAEAPDLNVDACAQVSHALSVHAVETEYDYFTAIDDNIADDDVAAGMLGTVEFNSSTLYRYATVNVSELSELLGQEAAAQGVGQFVQSFLTSMPTGKQNTFANRTLPEFCMVTIHDDQPFSLVGAFEDPVSPKNGHLRTATEKLLEHDRQLADAYGYQAVDRQILAIGLARDVVEKAGLTLSPVDALVRCAEDAVRTLPEA